MAKQFSVDFENTTLNGTFPNTGTSCVWFEMDGVFYLYELKIGENNQKTELGKNLTAGNDPYFIVEYLRENPNCPNPLELSAKTFPFKLKHNGLMYRANVSEKTRIGSAIIIANNYLLLVEAKVLGESDTLTNSGTVFVAENMRAINHFFQQGNQECYSNAISFELPVYMKLPAEIDPEQHFLLGKMQPGINQLNTNCAWFKFKKQYFLVAIKVQQDQLIFHEILTQGQDVSYIDNFLLRNETNYYNYSEPIHLTFG